jgi:hypothetical protein
MGRVHFVGGEKGGVGKSLVAKLLTQYCIDRTIPVVAFDTDRSHGSLLRSYAGHTRAIDVHRVADLDRIVEILEEGVEEVVVDLAGQSQHPLFDWIEQGDVLGFLTRLRHVVWYWYVIDDSKDSVLLLHDFLDRVDTTVTVVCVPNEGRAHDFALFEESKLRNRIEQAGGSVLPLPELHPDSMHRMDALDKSFWAAINNDDPDLGPCLTLMERQRAKIFIRRVHAALGELL